MTSQEFLEAYNSKKMYAYAMNEERCHIGSAPTLGDALHTHGRACILTCIDDLICSLVSFTSARVRLSDEQRQRLSWVILTQYPRLKITELILFVVKAQAGHFGKFYDRIDPLDITTALCKWWEMCDERRNDFLLKKRDREEIQERETREYEYEAHKTEIKTILLNGMFKFIN